jgi:hypothetical protein
MNLYDMLGQGQNPFGSQVDQFNRAQAPSPMQQQQDPYSDLIQAYAQDLVPKGGVAQPSATDQAQAGDLTLSQNLNAMQAGLDKFATAFQPEDPGIVPLPRPYGGGFAGLGNRGHDGLYALLQAIIGKGA